MNCIIDNFRYNLKSPTKDNIVIDDETMDEIIQNILNEDGSPIHDVCNIIKRVRYQYKTMAGMDIIQKTYQNPPEELPKYAECNSCYNQYPEKYHTMGCSNPSYIVFMDEFKNKLSGIYKDRYDEYKEEGELLYYYNIFEKTGKKTTKVKELSIKTAELYIDVGKHNYVMIILYKNASWEARKVVGIEPVDLFNMVNRCLVYLFNSMGIDIEYYNYSDAFITQVENTFNLGKDQRILTDSIGTFRTRDNFKASIRLTTRSFTVNINKGKEDEDFNKSGVITKDTLAEVCAHVYKLIEIEKYDVEPKKRITKLMNVYTPPDYFLNSKALKRNPPGIKGGKVKFFERTSPYSFHGVCPPGYINRFEGVPGQADQANLFFPQCSSFKNEFLGLTDETDYKVVQYSISKIRNKQNISKDLDIRRRDPWLKTLIDGFDVVPGERVSGYYDIHDADINEWKAKPNRKIQIRNGNVKSVNTKAQDKASGVYIPGKQSKVYNGDNSMSLDSRKWIGLNNMDKDELVRFASCVMNNITIIMEPPSPAMKLFDINPLFEFDVENFYGNTFKIPIQAVFVKVIIKNNQGFIIEKNGNLLKTFDIRVADAVFYAYIHNHVMIPLTPIDGTDIGGYTIFNLNKLNMSKNEFKYITLNEDKVRVSFNTTDYIQNVLVKSMTIDLYYKDGLLYYNGEQDADYKKVIYKLYNTFPKNIDYNIHNNQPDVLVYQFRSIKSTDMNNRWWRFRFAWVNDFQYNDVILYSHTKEKPIEPSYILYPIKPIKHPRDTYSETWNKYYTIIDTFLKIKYWEE